jgi:hypothetical protein
MNTTHSDRASRIANNLKTGKYTRLLPNNAKNTWHYFMSEDGRHGIPQLKNEDNPSLIAALSSVIGVDLTKVHSIRKRAECIDNFCKFGIFTV